MKEKIRKIREFIEKEKLGCLLIDSPFEILYLLNIKKSFNFVELNMLLIISPEKMFLITNPITLSFLSENLPNDIKVIETETQSYVEHHSRYIKEARQIIKTNKIVDVGLTSTMYLDAAEKCIRVINPVLSLSAIKSSEEIKLIRKSAQILRNVYKEIKKTIKTGCGEIELRNEIDVLLHSQGSEKRAFPTRVAFGKNTSNIFPVSTMKRLEDNDIISLDMGGLYKGYMADFGRTVFHGKVDAEKKEIYDIVLEAYKKMKAFIKPGIVASSADRVVRDHFAEFGHAKFFFHPLGESVGFVKGGIALAPDNNNVIKPGMTFVVEPALYLPNWGGVKIKETILITEQGMEELTGGPEKDD